MPRTKMCLTCGALSPNSYCSEHERKPYYTKDSAPKQYGRKRASAHARGYNTVYKALRTKFLAYWKATYGDVCAGYNRKPHAAPVLTADHIVPLSRGGTNTWDNLQALCLSCNSAKKAK